MRRLNILASVFLLALAAPLPAQTSGQPVFLPAAELKWADLDPNGAPGVKVADLWGDHAKGAFGA